MAITIYRLHIDLFGRDSSAFGGRPQPIHELKPVAPFAHEDLIRFNTQSTSQWDGLRHFGIRSKELFYNGYSAADFENSDALGIHSEYFAALDYKCIKNLIHCSSSLSMTGFRRYFWKRNVD